MRRYLVVAHQTLGSPELREAMLTRLSEGPSTFHLLVPQRQAGGSRRHGAEGAAHLGRGGWLHVVGVDVRRAAGHPVEDDGGVLARGGRLSLAQPKDGRQGEPAEAERADLQRHIAAAASRWRCIR